MSDYKKVTLFKKHKESPFMGELLEIKMDKRRKLIAGKSPTLIVNGDTGEVEGHQVFAITERVDKERFTKLYDNVLIRLFDLSKSALKVFAFFTTITKPNKGDVIFEMDACKEYTGYKTDKPILKGIAELIESNLIARSKYHYRYYINPSMFFNGNRYTYIESFIYDKSLDKPKIESEK